jgi:hypothetical protein
MNNEGEENKYETNQTQNEEHRKIRRHSNFDIEIVESEDGQQLKTIDNGYLTIKHKIGKGTYCKVNKVDCRVFRNIVNKLTGENELV